MSEKVCIVCEEPIAGAKVSPVNGHLVYICKAKMPHTHYTYNTRNSALEAIYEELTELRGFLMEIYCPEEEEEIAEDNQTV